MRFTKLQYDTAIQALIDGCQQLEPDGRHCACCGDSGHQAFECGHNPLVAMAICEHLKEESEGLHEAIHEEKMEGDPLERLHMLVHYLAGHDFKMGEVMGPACVVLPSEV